MIVVTTLAMLWLAPNPGKFSSSKEKVIDIGWLHFPKFFNWTCFKYWSFSIWYIYPRTI